MLLRMIRSEFEREAGNAQPFSGRALAITRHWVAKRLVKSCQCGLTLLTCEKIHDNRAHGFNTFGAGRINDIAQGSKVGTPDQAFDRAD